MWFVTEGDIASGMTLQYDSMTVYNGGMANSTTLNSRGLLYVHTTGTVTSTTINSAGYLYISSGGTANITKVNSFGEMHISSGGIANDTTVNAKGYLFVSSGGTATDIRVSSGARLIFYVTKDTYIIGTSGSSAFEIKDGIVSNYTVKGGSCFISSGGVVTSTTVIGTLDAPANLAIESGGTATNIIISSSTFFSILSDGIANNTTVNSDGWMDVEGTVNNTVISYGGELKVVVGGIANSTIISSGGSCIIYSGGTANDTTVYYGGKVLASGTKGIIYGGRLNNTMISSGGCVIVDAIGRANNTTVKSGGSFLISSGGGIWGRTMIEDGAIVSMYSGARLYFDISELNPETEARVNDLSRIKKQSSVVYGLLVSDTQEKGNYVLAGGAEGFNQTITVWNTAWESLGTLTLGETIIVDDTKYTLNLSESTLSLVVKAPDTTAPTISGIEASVTSPTNQNVVISAVFADDEGLEKTMYKLEGDKEWIDYIDGVIVSENTTVYFKAVDTSGNESEIATYHVMNIDKVKPDAPTASADIVIPTNGDVSVSATFSEDSAKKEYSLDGKEWITYTEPVLIMKNGIVSFRGTDEAGNESDITSYEVTNIIKTPPSKPVAVADVTIQTNGDVFVSASFSEDSIINEYSLDGDVWYTYIDPIKLTENGIIFFRSTDKAGNESEIETCEVSNIDKIPPEKPSISADITTITNADVLVSAAFSDDSTEKKYSLDGKDWLKYNNPAVFTENGTVYFKAIDAAGNESEIVSYTVNNIDKVAPSDPTGLNTVVSEQKVALLWSVSTDDFSGVKEYVMKYTLNNQEFTARTDIPYYVLNNADFGDYSWSVQAVDFAGNESAAIAGEAFTVSGFKPYTVEYSADNFEHVITFAVTTPSLDAFRMPRGTYQMRVKQEGSSEWLTGDPVVAEDTGDAPQLVKSDADGNADVFFANPVGTWESCYVAQHVGSINDWAGTNEFATLYGKNKLADIIEGSTDANILLMTDDENGDTLFVDDIYTASPGNIAEKQSRIAQLDEIRAGAGNDIVDMTSQQFEYIGDGLTIRGGAGNDAIWANKGDNMLFGDAGNDRIVGASGNDVIAGGIGNDRMHGGGGNDVFTFCENWGVDNVEQLGTGTVTLWFASGNLANWDDETLTYADGENSVKISGVSAEQVTLKFGDDGSAQFASLTNMGAFFDATTERIFDESGKGILASL